MPMTPDPNALAALEQFAGEPPPPMPAGGSPAPVPCGVCGSTIDPVTGAPIDGGGMDPMGGEMPPPAPDAGMMPGF